MIIISGLSYFGRAPDSDPSVVTKGYVDGGIGDAYDMSIVAFGKDTTRAVGLGDFSFGIKMARNVTLTEVVFRGATADASGNLVVELRKNNVQVAGTSTSIPFGSQITGGTSAGSWLFLADDILTVYVTAVGGAPGKGLIADITAVTAA